MEEIAWAAIGLLAVTVFGSFGLYFGLGTQLEGLSARMESGFARVDERFDRLETEMDGRSDRLEAKLDAKIDRIDDLTGSLSRHIENHPR